MGLLLINNSISAIFQKRKCSAGHDVNFCSDLPRRASEIQFSLALLQLSLALENDFLILHLKPSRTWFWHVKAYFLGQAWMADHETCTHSQK